ncbi:MAG: Gfo/Idh/MocA family oxidoreductase [Oscillospiraceae bacterium]|nr:Gfo/Idh/MocA family oxidoreductase [Oscillospiraceae bacterium]
MKAQNDRIRCAVIGTGAMGRRYAELIDSGAVDGLELTAVCCHSETARDWAAGALRKAVRVCGSEDELYEHRDEFDAVLVVTPHQLHPAMTIRALESGAHVMCDKPAGVAAADAIRMAEVAEKTGRIYAIMCHQRTYAKHIKIKELLLSGEIGKLTRISLIHTCFFRTEYYHSSASWRSSWRGEGGGALINQGHHILDLWIWLFGMPESIFARIPFGKYNSFSVDDESTIVMSYPDNVSGTFILSTGEGTVTERLEIVGTRGRILLEGDTLTITRLSEDTREYSKRALVTARQELSESSESFSFCDDGKAYEKMLRNFASAIKGGEALISPGAEGADTLMLINAAYLSAWEGRSVSLPIDNLEYIKKLALREESESAGAYKTE